MKLHLKINGRPYELDLPPMRRLLDLLRQDLELTGTKEGCGEGECGACAVLVDGLLVNACLVPACQLDGCSVTTIEGLGAGVAPDPLQEAFLDEGAVQCGFCIPGMLLGARALLDREPHPDEMRIREALSGNLCRCTGYEKIVRAVERVAAQAGSGAPGAKVTTPARDGAAQAGTAAARAATTGVAATVAPAAGAATAPTVASADETAASPPSSRSTHEGTVFLPSSLDEALHILSQEGPGLILLSGATDLLAGPQAGSLAVSRVMDLSRLPELRQIRTLEGRIEIGAGVTVGRILEDPEIARSLPLLHQAAAVFGAPAIRNRATLGGNIISASPAADLPPALLALEAVAILASANGRREVPLDAFFPAYRRTARREDEILAGLSIPLPAGNERWRFFKIGPRRAQSIAKISLAARAEIDGGGRIRTCRLAAGSVGPTVVLLEKTQKLLLGRPPDEALAREAGRLASQEVATIDDVRSTAHYRRTVLGRLVARFVREDIGA